MSKTLIEDQVSSAINYAEHKLAIAEYDSCRFVNCNFASTHLSGAIFIDCEFTDCDFSNAYVKETAFRDAQFVSCKALGVLWQECSELLFAINFEKCQLDFSSFYQMNLKNSRFTECSLKDVDFASANAVGVVFENCELTNAIC